MRVFSRTIHWSCFFATGKSKIPIRRNTRLETNGGVIHRYFIPRPCEFSRIDRARRGLYGAVIITDANWRSRRIHEWHYRRPIDASRCTRRCRCGRRRRETRLLESALRNESTCTDKKKVFVGLDPLVTILLTRAVNRKKKSRFTSQVTIFALIIFFFTRIFHPFLSPFLLLLLSSFSAIQG